MTTSKLVPKTVDVQLNWKTFTVRPFGFGQLPRVGSLIAPIFATLQVREGDVLDVATLLEKGGENLMDLLAFAVGQPREFIDALDFDEGAALLAAVVEVNREQFTKKILPAVTKAMGAGLTEAPAAQVAA